MGWLGNRSDVRTPKWRFLRAKMSSWCFSHRKYISYDLFSYILNHSNGSIKVISANIFILKVTLETLEKCMKYLQSYAQNWASIWATLSVLTFLTAGPKCVYTCTKNFCVNTSFSLLFRFLDGMKSLKQSPGDSCILILSLTLTLKLRSTWSY